VSHEIRTPINGVVGFARLLRETPLALEQLGFVETIHRCGMNLEQLVSDILDLSKIEAGRMEIQSAPFSLRDCVADVSHLFAEQVKRAGLSYEVNYDDRIPAVLEGDQNRLRQILINLVGNAVKFTEKGGIRLELGCDFTSDDYGSRRGEVMLRVAVHDTGVGIPPEQQNRLFKAFTQLDSSSTRRHGGTGLGLVISKRLCELMAGGITMTSQPGAGSIFRFQLKMHFLKGDTAQPFVTSMLNSLPAR
jgi:signal transduction histidine kinase